MDHFHYQNGALYAEALPVTDIMHAYGSPCYIYSRATIEHHWHVMQSACASWPSQLCYAVKANDNLAVLDLLNRLGAGFDIVSGGELERVLHIGACPSKVVFSGVGKTQAEIERALEVGICCFNIESNDELLRINACAHGLNKIAPIAVRINPHVDAKTHPYIATGLQESKFGVEARQAEGLYLQAKTLSHIKILGIDCHIGSQITTLDPFITALKSLLTFIDTMATHGITFEHIDMGGGLGVPYQKGEVIPAPAEYIGAMLAVLGRHQKKIPLILEPGRMIMANAGILVGRIEYIKQTQTKRFAVIDAGMNDLLRPALYQAWHEIIPVAAASHEKQQTYDVVGPVCESADCFGKNRQLALTQGDYLAIRSAGAYGACMASHYNARPRIAEVMVDGSVVHLIRKPQTFSDLWRDESRLP